MSCILNIIDTEFFLLDLNLIHYKYKLYTIIYLYNIILLKIVKSFLLFVKTLNYFYFLNDVLFFLKKLLKFSNVNSFLLNNQTIKST